MKTTTTFLKALYVLVLTMLLSTNFGCAGLFNAEYMGEDLPMKDGLPDMEKIEQLIIDDFRKSNKDLFPQSNFYSQSFLELSGGFGLDSNDGESETSFCLGAGYNYRISEDNFNHASYLKGSASYHSQNADEIKLNLTRVGVGYTYFDRVNKTGDLDFTYGVDFNYGFGSNEFFGNKDDLTEIKASFNFGANYSISPKVDVGITMPVFSWDQQTFESGGFEFKEEHTWLGLNKNNMVMAYARIKLN